MISAQLEAAHQAGELEMEELLLQLVGAKNEAEEIVKCGQMAEQAWRAERESFLSLLRRYDKRITDVSLQNKRVLLQYRAEKIALESKFNYSQARTQELLGKMENDKYLWDSEKGNLESIVAELQTKLDSMASERGLLSQKNRELSTEAESFKAQFGEYNARLALLEYERQKNERLLCQCSAEKIDLQSMLNESQGKTQDLLIKIAEERRLSDAEKSNLEGVVAKLRAKLDFMASESGFLNQKSTKLSTEAESLKSRLNALESMRGTQELVKKIEEERHMWAVEKRTLECTLAELQTNLDLMASEREFMIKNNIELSIELQFLKTQVNEYNAELVSMEGERQGLKEFARNENRMEVFLTKTSTIQNEINSLQHVIEEVKQDSDLIQQYKETEHSLKQRTEILQEEVDSAKGLLETQNQRVEELNAENGRLNKQVEELSKRIVELQETHVKLVQEKEEQEMELELLHAESAKKYRQVEKKHLESLKENEEQRKMIESLQGENASLQIEKSLLQSLKEATKRSQELSKKCLERNQRVLDLESQSLRLRTELVATKLEGNKVTIQLNKIKEDLKKSNDSSYQIQEEQQESLHEKLMIQLSRNKALEEELRSTKSSLEEMKESASKGEQQIHDVWSQLLAFAKEEDDQIFDIQGQLLTMIEEKSGLIADLQDQLSYLAAAKMFVDEENNSLQIELDRRALVSEQEKVTLTGRVRDLETGLESLNKDIESFRAITEEKEGKIVVFQYQLSEIAEAKICLEEKNNSLLTNLNKCTKVSEENACLQERIRELETVMKNFNKDPDSKDYWLQKLKGHKPLEGKSPVKESGKVNCVHGRENGVNEKPKPNGAIGKRTSKLVYEKQTSSQPVPEKQTPKQVPEKPKKIWLC